MYQMQRYLLYNRTYHGMRCVFLIHCPASDRFRNILLYSAGRHASIPGRRFHCFELVGRRITGSTPIRPCFRCFFHFTPSSLFREKCYPFLQTLQNIFPQLNTPRLRGHTELSNFPKTASISLGNVRKFSNVIQ